MSLLNCLAVSRAENDHRLLKCVLSPMLLHVYKAAIYCSKGSLASWLLLLADYGTMDPTYTLSCTLSKFLSHVGSTRSSMCWVSCDPKCSVRELFHQNYKSNLILIHVTFMCCFQDLGRLQPRVTFRSFVDVILCQLDNHLLKPGRQAGRQASLSNERISWS